MRALTLDINDGPALEGIVKAALLARRVPDALSWVRGLTMDSTQSTAVRVTISQLYAANGMAIDAMTEARDAVTDDPASVAAREQVAALLADSGDAAALRAAVEELATRVMTEIAVRRETGDLGDDLTGAILRATPGGEPLEEHHVIGYLVNLLLGGMDTTGVDIAAPGRNEQRLGDLARTEQIGLPGLSAHHLYTLSSASGAPNALN